MAHYAFLDENNIVTEVIVGRNEDEVVDGISDWEEHYSQVRGQRCLRTSINGNIRRTFARVGSRYDEETDCFILPQPFPSWTLEDGYWVPPVAMPDNIVDGHMWIWNEDIVDWEDIDIFSTVAPADTTDGGDDSGD
jgi:hypothetical protein